MTTIDDVPLDVRKHFDRYAVVLFMAGFKHYSSDAVLHRVRWHQQVERGHRDFKCNNNWTAPLARWCLRRHPGDFTVELFAQRHGRLEEAQSRRSSIQLELIPA